MKLHLPKRLLAALLATFTVVTTFSSSAWAGEWSGGDCYTFTGEGDAESLDATGYVGDNGTWLRAGAENLNATLSTLTQVEGSTLNISGTWNNSTNYFNTLTVEELIIGDGTGSGVLRIAKEADGVTTNQYVNINKVSGTISNLVVSSTGTLQLGTDDGANTFTIGAGTIESGGKLNLAGGTYKITGLSNSGTVVIDKGSADVVLNDLIGNSIGKYNHDAISNTPTGNLVINSGAKTLSGDITIANGGKVTLKGGTFGSSGASINKDICLGSDTVLAFEDIEAYISRKENNVSRDVTGQWEIGSGAKVHFTQSDVFKWEHNLNLKVLTGVFSFWMQGSL